MEQGQYATEHDAKVARKLAYVMCGGDLSEPTLVSEQYLLNLERKPSYLFAAKEKHWNVYRVLLKQGSR
ncbi:hypothetical protein LWM68_37655 [Niabella sp. W65]|nr:hypothetical protein [Niabella sp. W65]MCH7367969.1 hypothetical protein [Niabella sp. W65]